MIAFIIGQFFISVKVGNEFSVLMFCLRLKRRLAFIMKMNHTSSDNKIIRNMCIINYTNIRTK